MKTPEEVAFEEQVVLSLKNGETRIGNVIQLSEDITTIQVYEGTSGLHMTEVKTEFIGKPLRLKLAPSMLGRVFNGVGEAIDGLEEIEYVEERDINSKPINPVSRTYPRNYIETGISCIDGLMTLIRGQKLTLLTGRDIKHK